MCNEIEHTETACNGRRCVKPGAGCVLDSVYTVGLHLDSHSRPISPEFNRIFNNVPGLVIGKNKFSRG